MVSNVNQVSSNVQTTVSSSQASSTPTESFQTVLMNAGTNSASVDANKAAPNEQAPEMRTARDDSTKVEEAAALVSDVFVSNVQPEVVNLEQDMTVQGLNVSVETIGNLYESLEVVVAELPEIAETILSETELVSNLENTIDVAFNEVITDLETSMPNVEHVATTQNVTEPAENTVENVVTAEAPEVQAAINENASVIVPKEHETARGHEEVKSSNTQNVVDSSVVATEVSSEAQVQAPVMEHVSVKASNMEQYISNPTALQVVNRIVENFENVKAFKNEISFVLNPASLGRVAVRMIVERGTLTVELAASSKNTQNILAENLESIKEVLRNIAIDNQVREILDHGQENYLEDRNNQNPQKEQDGQADAEKDSSNQYTEDFLSMLDFMSSEQI